MVTAESGDPNAGAVSRRGFLHAGGVGVVGLSAESVAGRTRRRSPQSPRCLFIMMTGGPSQLETFDPKPDAPSGIRGPSRAIATSVPGTFLSEGLPRLAQQAHRFSLIRSLHHDAAPIHETGHQLLLSGRLTHRGIVYPNVGAVVSRSRQRRSAVPGWYVIPGVPETGVSAGHGQSAGPLGDRYAAAIDPADDAPSHDVRRQNRYGSHRYGRLIARAGHLLEQGAPCVIVNLHSSLHNQITWDCHGKSTSGPAMPADYRDELCPAFDQAVSALLDDLTASGLLDSTLVVATGEFGRTPRLNEHGGRDHWTSAWSALVAGGGMTGGQVIGKTDRHGAEPVDRPVHASELHATALHHFGLNSGHSIPTESGAQFSPCDAEPVRELFA